MGSGAKDNPGLRDHLRAIEDALNTRCPRCKSVFYDFNGCYALTCGNGNCGIGFCGFCLADCGRDAHRHVSGCALNPRKGEYFHPLELFHEVHRRRFTGLIKQQLTSVKHREGQKMVDRVIEELAKSTLPDLKIPKKDIKP